MSQNPFLRDNFAPVTTEKSCSGLKVKGELPTALQGTYIQNGGNPQFPNRERHHPFDGDGMLHAIHLEKGLASYQNRYIQTDAYLEEKAAGESLWGGLLEPMQWPQRSVKNPANTSIIQHAGKTLALWEQGKPYEIELPGLNTLGKYDFGGGLQHAMTAHPKRDPVSGELFVFGYQTVQVPFLQYSVFSEDGNRVHHTSIKLSRGVMMHDFAITEDYVIFFELPYTFDLKRLRSEGKLGGFDASQQARLGVMPRYADGESINWINIDPCYVFHIVNAYQQTDQIIVDVCRYQDLPMPINPRASYVVDFERLLRADTKQPRLSRWLIDLHQFTYQQLSSSEMAMELPRINEAYVGRFYEYAYLAYLSADSLPPIGTAYVKYNVQNQQAQVHTHGDGRLGGEAVFAPDPNDSREDAGWLLGFVYDQSSGCSDFVVVSALEPERPPVAIVNLPFRVPYGIHGIWLPEV